MPMRAHALGLTALLLGSLLVGLAPPAQAVTNVNVYLLVRWDGEGCVGTGTGTSISLVARDTWQASGTVTKSWPGTLSATRCKGDSSGGLIQVGPVSLIKYDGFHVYRLEASITDASGTVTSFSANQNMKVGGSCTASTYYMGTNDVYCSSTQPSANYLGRANAMPSDPAITFLYPDTDPQHSLHLAWSGPSSMPLDFNQWEVHMGTQPGFTVSYSFPSTLKATTTWGTQGLTITGLSAGTQYCFKVRNTDRYWKSSDITYRQYRSWGESAERCASTQADALRVTSPNGGEVWSGTHSVTWTGGSPDFTVAVSQDSGGSYATLATGVGGRSTAWDTRGGPDGATYRVQVRDGAGSDASDADLTVDNTPPVTTADVQGAQCNGWYAEPPTVTLTATDNLAGVRSTRWRLDGGASQAYAGPFTVQGDGRRDLRWGSDDQADAPNVETEQNRTLPVDTLPPVTTLIPGTPRWQGDRLYVNRSTDLGLDAVDAGSGVNVTEYRLDGGAWQAYNGTFRLDGADREVRLGYRSTDYACHAEDEREQVLFLDDTPPDVSLERPQAASVVVDDEELTGGLPALPSGLPVALPDLPPQQACDIARIVHGGLDAYGAGDAGALLEAALCSPADAPAVVVGNVTVRVNATDPVVNGGASGMDRVEFYVDGALRATDGDAPYAWTWDTTRDGTGLHALRVVAYDHLGQTNEASRQVLVVAPPAGLDACALLGGLGAPDFVQALVAYALQQLGLPCALSVALPTLPTLP